MRWFLILLVLVPAFAGASTCESDLNVPVKSGSVIGMQLRPGDYELVSTDDEQMRVTCRLDDRSREREVNISFREGSHGGDLQIEGGPTNRVHFKIFLPHQTNLRIRCTAGNIHVRDVAGDKDIELRAGNLEITGADPRDYGRFNATVRAGNIEARRFGGNKSGLLRSFEYNGHGKYRLLLHVTAGNVAVN